MRYNVSFTRRYAELLSVETATTWIVVSNPALGGAVTPRRSGNKRHLEGRIDGPGNDPASAIVISQRCFPARRQHAGKLDLLFDANAAGSISEKPKRASSDTASVRRTSSSYIWQRHAVKMPWTSARTESSLAGATKTWRVRRRSGRTPRGVTRQEANSGKLSILRDISSKRASRATTSAYL